MGGACPEALASPEVRDDDRPVGAAGGAEFASLAERGDRDSMRMIFEDQLQRAGVGVA